MNRPVAYVDPPDCPEGMTLREWHRLRHPFVRSRRRRLMDRLRRRPRAERRRA